jgi:hypothetical protein
VIDKAIFLQEAKLLYLALDKKSKTGWDSARTMSTALISEEEEEKSITASFHGVLGGPYNPQFLVYGVGGSCIALVLASAKLGPSEYALEVRLRYQQDVVFHEKRVVFDDPRTRSQAVCSSCACCCPGQLRVAPP